MTSSLHGLQGKGYKLSCLIREVVCLLAVPRVLTLVMDDRIVRCGITSSCRPAATPESDSCKQRCIKRPTFYLYLYFQPLSNVMDL